MKKTVALFLCLFLMLPAAALAETVVTSFYPVWLLTLNLTEGIEGLDVVNLAEPSTGCLHDYTLQNSDMVVLSGADALLINGGGMESFLPVLTGACPDLPVVDASEGIPTLMEGDTVEIGEPEDGETVNSHFWLDPQCAAAMASNLADGLIRLFPDRARQLSDNLSAFLDRLQALDDTMAEALQSLPKKNVVIFHEAFPYFARACGLPVLAVVNKEPDDDLSSAQLARILELVRGEAALPLVLKSAEEDRSVSVLVNEIGLPVCELDPIVSGPENPPMDYYEAVMIRNLEILRAALAE